jgi:undecaprenyl-diphosphatase
VIVNMTHDLEAGIPVAAAPARDTDQRAGHGSQAGDLDGTLLLIALLALGGFALLTLAVARMIVFPFDQPLLALARGWDGWPVVWNSFSQSANIPLIVIGIGLVVWLFLTKRRREALLVVLMLVAVTAGSEGIKQLVGRPRPSGTGDGIPGVVYSYPSGHVLEVLTILGIIAVRGWRSSRRRLLRVALVAFVAIEVVLVGVARLALNEHFPTDVLAGLLGGIGALSIYAWLTRPAGWASEPPADSHEARDAYEAG